MCTWLQNNLLALLDFLALIGLSLWGRVWVNKKKAQQDQRIEELKLSLLKEQTIHKLQFEKEFEVYDYLWMKIAHLKKHTAILYDKLDAPNIKKEFAKFLITWEDVKETINIRAPFISKEVYKICQAILKLAASAFDAEKPPQKSELGKIKKEIANLSSKVEEAIRERIKNIGEAKLIE